MAVGGCSSTAQLESIQAQLTEIQNQLLEIHQGQASAAGGVEEAIAAMADDVGRLRRIQADTRAEVERLIDQVGQTQSRLVDANQRLDRLSQETATILREVQELGVRHRVLSETDPVNQLAPLPSDPTALYQSARQAYAAGNYDFALRAFQRYEQAYRDGPEIDSVPYWVGLCYYGRGEYRRAIDQFERVRTRYPDTHRMASILLKMGSSYLKLGDRQRGRTLLETVIRDYSGSDEASLARDELDQDSIE